MNDTTFSCFFLLSYCQCTVLRTFRPSMNLHSSVRLSYFMADCDSDEGGMWVTRQSSPNKSKSILHYLYCTRKCCIDQDLLHNDATRRILKYCMKKLILNSDMIIKHSRNAVQLIISMIKQSSIGHSMTFKTVLFTIDCAEFSVQLWKR